MKTSIITKSIIIALTSFGIMACNKDKETITSTASGQYVLQVRAEGSTESSDYIIGIDDLMTGEIDVQGKGIEQTGWRTCVQAGSSVFSIGYGDPSAISYKIENGEIIEKGKFIFAKTLDCMGMGDANTLLAMEVPRGKIASRTLHKIDINGISISEKINTEIYTGTGDTLHKWPTAMVVRDGFLYISYYPISPSGNFSTPSVDTAYIAVYTYPAYQFVKVIKDTRTSPIGLYGDSNGIIKDTETGDLYTLSTSSLACGFTNKTKPSGILRIKNGSTEFDASYFLNFEQLSGGYKLQNMVYASNGKVVARIVTDDTKLWGAYNLKNIICKLVIIDLNTQTVTDVAGVPMHGGQYSTPSLVENGKVYMSISNTDGTYVYQIDPSTATASKGAKVNGVEVAGFFKLQ